MNAEASPSCPSSESAVIKRHNIQRTRHIFKTAVWSNFQYLKKKLEWGKEKTKGYCLFGTTSRSTSLPPHLSPPHMEVYTSLISCVVSLDDSAISSRWED